MEDAREGTLDRFKDLPRNKDDWFGGVVMCDTETGEFYNVEFGSGDNLSTEDIDAGYDDYIMVDRYRLDGSVGMAYVVTAAVDAGRVDESTGGLRSVDGGQLLLKRSEWVDGDIRRFIGEAMDFAGFGADKDGRYENVVWIASHH